MANTDRPRGLEPHGVVLRAEEYVAGSTVYPGDPVALSADGAVDRTATAPLLGVALDYATVGQKVRVADHPDQRFIIQADDASIADVTSVGANFDIVLGTADTTYKKSTAELDGDTAAASATTALKLLGKSERVDNEYGANCDCLVKINNHQLAGGTGTAAV